MECWEYRSAVHLPTHVITYNCRVPVYGTVPDVNKHLKYVQSISLAPDCSCLRILQDAGWYAWNYINSWRWVQPVCVYLQYIRTLSSRCSLTLTCSHSCTRWDKATNHAIIHLWFRGFPTLIAIRNQQLWNSNRNTYRVSCVSDGELHNRILNPIACISESTDPVLKSHDSLPCGKTQIRTRSLTKPVY